MKRFSPHANVKFEINVFFFFFLHPKLQFINNERPKRQRGHVIFISSGEKKISTRRPLRNCKMTVVRPLLKIFFGAILDPKELYILLIISGTFFINFGIINHHTKKFISSKIETIAKLTLWSIIILTPCTKCSGRQRIFFLAFQILLYHFDDRTSKI